MVSKLPRFRLKFGYVLPMTDKIMYGKLEEKIFTFKDLEFFLRVLSPTNSISWIQNILQLRKNGYYSLKFDETTNEGTIKKVLKITRN